MQELSQNVGIVSTTLEQIAKDIHDMKHEPKSISDEQIRRMVNDIVPQIPVPKCLPEDAVDIIRSLATLPLQLYERLEDSLSTRKVEFAEDKQAFKETLQIEDSSLLVSQQEKSMAKSIVANSSPLGATTQNTQPRLAQSGETLNIQLTGGPSAEHNNDATIGILTGREMVMYSNDGSETISRKDLSHRLVPIRSKPVVHADTLLHEIGLPGNDRSFPVNDPQARIHNKEPEDFMGGPSGILQKLNRIEDKLDCLLAMKESLGNDMCNLDNPRERSPSGFLNSSDVPKKTAISPWKELEPERLICGPKDDVQIALRESSASNYDIDLMNSEFPPLIPGRSVVQVMASSSILDRPQALECADTQRHVKSEQNVSGIRPPPSQTRSQDRGSITAPYKRRRLIKFSSEDEEDGPEAAKRFRSGLSLSHDTGISRMQKHDGSDSPGKQILSCSTTTTEKLETDGAEHPNVVANSALLQNRRRISVSPDLL
ncbi:hypothetical protein QFC19_001389 [Naganishia cerealis]|uniref:Uncharacterized protein n=1 Tax=Naganishia cerealis TaxID=610337 RepID=A0ACC2WI64_9TREE|nr:hypothetical protein QFC19_001389 [Naganishia cerealis]